MTAVRVDLGSPGTLIAARTRLDVDGTGRILPAAPLDPVPLAGPTIIDLDPTDPGEAWRIRIYPRANTPWTWWVTIPATDDVVPLTDLPRIDPATLAPTASPTQPVWTAQLTQEREARAAELADVRAALAALPTSAPASVSHIAVTAEGRLVHRAGGTTTLSTTPSGRLAMTRA